MCCFCFVLAVAMRVDRGRLCADLSALSFFEILHQVVVFLAVSQLFIYRFGKVQV
jgi:hypothetical protein